MQLPDYIKHCNIFQGNLLLATRVEPYCSERINSWPRCVVILGLNSLLLTDSHLAILFLRYKYRISPSAGQLISNFSYLLKFKNLPLSFFLSLPELEYLLPDISLFPIHLLGHDSKMLGGPYLVDLCFTPKTYSAAMFFLLFDTISQAFFYFQNKKLASSNILEILATCIFGRRCVTGYFILSFFNSRVFRYYILRFLIILTILL